MSLVVTNVGGMNASPVIVTDLCPVGLTCESYTFNGQIYPITNNNLSTINLAPGQGLAPGASVSITVLVKVDSSAIGPITNTASVYLGTVFQDDDPAYLTVQALPKNFSITKTALGALIPGQNITYTFQICNTDAGAIGAYALTDPLPSGMSYVLGTTTFDGFTASNPVNN